VQSISTKDGRTLCVHEDGDPNGLPVLMHHGTPASGVLYDAHVGLAREQGIRLLGYDRPGYGGSTRHEGRSVADAASDASAIADHLGLERYCSWGISGGGPHVLACAALCDERLVAVASLAAVADATDPEALANALSARIGQPITAGDVREWQRRVQAELAIPLPSDG